MMIICHLGETVENPDYTSDPSLRTDMVPKMVRVFTCLIKKYGAPHELVTSPYEAARESYQAGAAILDSHGVTISFDPRLGRQFTRRESPAQLTPKTREFDPVLGESAEEFRDRIRERYDHYCRTAETYRIWIMVHSDVMRLMATLAGRVVPAKLDYHNHFRIVTKTGVDKSLGVDYLSSRMEAHRAPEAAPASSSRIEPVRAPIRAPPVQKPAPSAPPAPKSQKPVKPPTQADSSSSGSEESDPEIDPFRIPESERSERRGPQRSRVRPPSGRVRPERTEEHEASIQPVRYQRPRMFRGSDEEDPEFFFASDPTITLNIAKLQGIAYEKDRRPKRKATAKK